MVTLPLFPLPVVLFPGTRMPLQIFEPRYLRMVSDAFKEGHGFVIVQTRPDTEPVDGQTPFYDVGGYGEIVDFSPLPNDRLGIVVHGRRRVRIGQVHAEEDNLLMGQCEWLPDESAEAVPSRFETLQQLLREMIKHPALKPLAGEAEIENAVSLGFRLADWLPFTADDKQELLACEGAGKRLQLIDDAIDWDE
ncbi:MAG: LON peptidase substrate-binding domain-containing protein [Oceanospirillaceae bacterium]|nr:LON peptidase substrate-binding domain-containing protein [Oceanospirillaceae bacterium]